MMNLGIEFGHDEIINGVYVGATHLVRAETLPCDVPRFDKLPCLFRAGRPYTAKFPISLFLVGTDTFPYRESNVSSKEILGFFIGIFPMWRFRFSAF